MAQRRQTGTANALTSHHFRGRLIIRSSVIIRCIGCRYYCRLNWLKVGGSHVRLREVRANGSALLLLMLLVVMVVVVDAAGHRVRVRGELVEPGVFFY